ncbi:MAG: hypothetical protein ABEH66_07455 [Halobacteriales archaeon]
MQPNPSPDLSALPGARIVAGVSLLALAALALQVLAAPALAGLLLAVLGIAAAVVVLPLGVVALGRALTAPRREECPTADDAPAIDERSVPAD